VTARLRRDRVPHHEAPLRLRLAIPRQFGGGQTRYEAAAGREHHDHMICTRCGGIVEFANEKIESLQELVRRHGFEVETHKLELYGLRPVPERARGDP